MKLIDCDRFLRSKSARGLLIYLLLCIGLSGLAGLGLYYSNLDSFKQHKGEEKITALQLVDAFVTTYSAIITQESARSPVPASFRAHSIERFNREKGAESGFSLRWVGRQGREIATPPGDPNTAATIEAFAASSNPKPAAYFFEINNQQVFRTVYPSLAHEQSCIDCHNSLQPNGIVWQKNDVMGAFVIDVATGPFLTEIRWSSIAFGAIFFLALAGVGAAFSILHFRQMEAREAAEVELSLRVDERTEELRNARNDLINRHQSDIRYLEWLRRLASFLRHEVRHPVAQITSSIELIQLAHKDDSAIRPYVTSATQGAQHVWNLVERASRATDAEAFVRDSRPQAIDLSELLGELISGYQQIYSGIEFSFEAWSPIWINADPMLLKEAVGNLLTNAASFAHEGTIVAVGLNREPGRLIVQIANIGPLIGGDAEALFGPFSSTRSGPSSEHHGLGLYLVRLVAEHYGGTAKIVNLEDRSGVVASISIPIAM